MKYLKLLFTLLLPIISGGQTLTGFIYDHEAPVNGVKIINRTQHILAYSDDKGAFRIDANSNDVLVINSYFHEQQFLTVNDSYFKDGVVIELKKITNTLDEIEITEVREKVFDSLAFSSTTAQQGQIAYKKRTFGSGANYQPTLDLIALGKLIGKLFKKKNKAPGIRYVTTDDLIRLFETNTYFNQKYLRQDLQIQKPYQELFFEYCSAQQLHSSILEKENEFTLVDLLLTHSAAFNKLLKEQRND